MGFAEVRVAILSAMETVNAKVPSTVEAAALCKMADRGQITGGAARWAARARQRHQPRGGGDQGIVSPVAGRAERAGGSRPRGRQHAGQEPVLPGRRGCRGDRARSEGADHPDQPRGFSDAASRRALSRSWSPMRGASPRKRRSTEGDVMTDGNSGPSSRAKGAGHRRRERGSIAYGCAKAFRAAGADLAITWLNEKARPHVEPLAQELEAAITGALDVSVPGQLEAMFDRIAAEWGRLDILCPLDRLRAEGTISRAAFSIAPPKGSRRRWTSPATPSSEWRSSPRR